MQTQEREGLSAELRCICEILNLKCKHGLQLCACTLCRKEKAAASPRVTPTFGCTTPRQLAAIVKLAQIKGRSLPSNISSWSVSFASKYIKFLAELPFQKEYRTREATFLAEHREGTDYYKATHFGKPVEYMTQDGMTRPLNAAIEKGDSEDLAAGITEVQSV